MTIRLLNNGLFLFPKLDSPRPPGKKGLDMFLKKIPITEVQEYRNKLFVVTREDLICVSERFVVVVVVWGGIFAHALVSQCMSYAC